LTGIKDLVAPIYSYDVTHHHWRSIGLRRLISGQVASKAVRCPATETFPIGDVSPRANPAHCQPRSHRALVVRRPTGTSILVKYSSRLSHSFSAPTRPGEYSTLRLDQLNTRALLRIRRCPAGCTNSKNQFSLPPPKNPDERATHGKLKKFRLRFGTSLNSAGGNLFSNICSARWHVTCPH
jgi:hypothetical protein